MAVVYFDTSAFVKLLVEEDGADVAAQLWDGCDLPVASRLAYPEVRAALAAASRAGRLSDDDLAYAQRRWQELWQAVAVVEVSDEVGEHAGELVGRHGLRGADGVHLASALAMTGIDPVVAVWDQRLRDCALAAGLCVAPAPEPTSS